MNYQNIYDRIINRAKSLEKYRKDVYVEVHHIIPLCIGGSNKKENLVILTAREHYICHNLLWRIYPNNLSLKHAFSLMTFAKSGGQERNYRVNSFTYERLKKERAQQLSEQMKGENNPFYGKTHSEETKDKIRKKAIGRKMSAKCYAHFQKMIHEPKSPEHRAKIGRRGMVTLRNKITNEVIRVSKDDPRVTDENWQNAKIGVKEKQYTCPWCGFVGNHGTVNQYHNDYCKLNPNRKERPKKVVTKQSLFDLVENKYVQFDVEEIPNIDSTRYVGRMYGTITYKNIKTGKTFRPTLGKPIPDYINEDWVKCRHYWYFNFREKTTEFLHEPDSKGRPYIRLYDNRTDLININTGEVVKFNVDDVSLVGKILFPCSTRCVKLCYNVCTNELEYFSTKEKTPDGYALAYADGKFLIKKTV